MTNKAIPDAATQLEIYRRMTLIKQNDERARKLILSGKFAMPYYSPRGQEVIPASICVNLRPDDYVCTTYRGTHDMLAKGVPLRELWAEFAGKAEGLCKGKGGPMHITHPKSGVMLTTGIVGATMPIANGLAWASRLAGNGRVTVANFGDGATNIGAFHESLNMASVWKLPVVFVCQNNLYGEHTAYGRSTSAKHVVDRAIGYQMPGISVDGNDPLAMYAAAHEAITRARAGEGPTLIEAMTFRFFGHVFGDADAYIPKAEKEAAMKADPFPRFRASLISNGIATEAVLTGIERDIEKALDEAVAYAIAGKFPTTAELRRDVYASEITS